MKNKLFASVPNILFGALITIAPQTFAHACTGHDMPGACHYSQQAATGIGVVILVELASSLLAATAWLAALLGPPLLERLAG